jgi:tetratricopeptide (TPR) repeat protein
MKNNTNIILVFVCLVISQVAFGQRKKKKQDEAALIENVKANLSDFFSGDKLIGSTGKSMCEDFDSLELVVRKGSDIDIKEEIKSRIQTSAMSVQLMGTLFKIKNDNENKSTTIQIGSEEDLAIRRKLEDWLMDSCAAFKSLMNSHNDDIGIGSKSINSDAIRNYNEGLDLLANEKYSQAIDKFQNAVLADSQFAYAWDNLGICNRKLNNLDAAIAAYSMSMKINPLNETPIQNAAVAYTLKSDYQNALAMYKKLAKLNDKNPEVFYGMAQMYITMGKKEEALENICKAYALYVENNSPFRVDAEKIINRLYALYKKDDNTKEFHKVTKSYGINFKD